MVITGDPSQIDLPKGETSGLMEAAAILEHVNEVGIIYFGSRDIVRSSIVQKIVTAYDARDGKTK